MWSNNNFNEKCFLFSFDRLHTMQTKSSEFQIRNSKIPRRQGTSEKKNEKLCFVKECRDNKSLCPRRFHIVCRRWTFAKLEISFDCCDDGTRNDNNDNTEDERSRFPRQHQDEIVAWNMHFHWTQSSRNQAKNNCADVGIDAKWSSQIRFISSPYLHWLLCLCRCVLVCVCVSMCCNWRPFSNDTKSQYNLLLRALQ